MRMMKSFLMMALVVAATANVFAQKKADPTGKWKFYAEAAPYEYNSGDIVIGKEGQEYTAKIVFGEYYEVKGRDVAVEKDQLSFYVWIEDEKVSIKGTIEGEVINGKATYSEGTISFKAEKQDE
jgi:hypothetical protein